MIKVTLRDDVKEFESGITVAEIAKSIGMGLYKAALGGRINGEYCDLRTPVTEDCELEIVTFGDDLDGKKTFWHTASHILAQAVKRLYPNTKLAIGPAIDNGFYYDFDSEVNFTPEILEKIEAEMKKIVKENLPRERYEMTPDEALKYFEDNGEIYKVELIKEHAAKGENITLYKQGEFNELCAGPHIMSTGSIKAFKLTSCTGAYWRGDEKNKMLQRIYGVAFPKAAELEEHLARIEEAKKSLSCLQQATLSVRDFRLCFRRAQELFSFFSVLLRMRNRREAGFLPKHRLWQRATFIKSRDTGITILTVCSFWAIRQTIQRNALHSVL